MLERETKRYATYLILSGVFVAMTAMALLLQSCSKADGRVVDAIKHFGPKDCGVAYRHSPIRNKGKSETAATIISCISGSVMCVSVITEKFTPVVTCTPTSF